jgi:hypothetical protein
MNKLLAEGLTDAAGFVAGGLLGFFAGRLLGWDLAAAGSDAAGIGAILLCGLGGGAGVQIARRLAGRGQGPK